MAKNALVLSEKSVQLMVISTDFCTAALTAKASLNTRISSPIRLRSPTTEYGTQFYNL